MKTNQTKIENEKQQSNSKGWLKWLIPGIGVVLLLSYFGMRPSSDTSYETARSHASADGSTMDSPTTVKGSAASTFNATGSLFNESENTSSHSSSSQEAASSNSHSGSVSSSSSNRNVSSSSQSTHNATSASHTAHNSTSSTSNTTRMDANSATGTASQKMVSYSVNQAGDLVNTDGKVMYKAGDYTVSKEGYYLDKKGNRLGTMLKKVGDAVGKAANATGKAVGTAAEKTGAFFNKTFTKMFKKEAGVASNYTLSNIEFNPESHRITNFSKAEVEGLAKALQANPNAKIQVLAHTNDGKSDKENKTLSASRAKVVYDMLVTLGVNKKQISSKGMGSKEASKASGDKVEIFVD